MKRILGKLIFGLLLGGGLALGIPACNDPDGVIETVSYDRCLMPLNFKCKLDKGNIATLSWDKMAGADAFWLLISKNEHADIDVAGYTPQADDIYVEVRSDKPTVWTGALDVDATYYAYVNARKSGDRAPQDSKWASVAFRTRQFAEPVRDFAVKSVSQNSLAVRWAWDEDYEAENAYYIDHIRIVPVPTDAAEHGYTVVEDEFDGTYARLDVAVDPDGPQTEATLEHLDPGTRYTVNLHFKSADRSGLTYYTKPDNTGFTSVADVEELRTQIANGATKILLTDAEHPYELNSYKLPDAADYSYKLTVPAGQALHLIGDESADTPGKFPTIHGCIEFSGVIWDGESAETEADGSIVIESVNLFGVDKTTDTDPLNLCCLQTGANNLKVRNIVLRNCRISTYRRSLYYGSHTGEVDRLLLEGVTAWDMGSGQDGIDLRKGTYGDITIRNSTFYNGFREFFRVDYKASQTDNATFKSATIENNTFYKLGVAASNALLYVRDDKGGARGDFKFRKNVVMNFTEGVLARPISPGSGDNLGAVPTFEKNFFCKVNEKFWQVGDKENVSAKAASAGGGAVLANLPCEKDQAEEGIFTVTNADILSAGAGDPRWLQSTGAVETGPVEPTLTPVTELKNWDLTAKKLFVAGDVAQTQIIDNLQLIVDPAAGEPLRIVHTGGHYIEFPRTSRGSDGIPTNGAVAFKVAGEGYLNCEFVSHNPGDAYRKFVVTDGSSELFSGYAAAAATGKTTEFALTAAQVAAAADGVFYLCADADVHLFQLAWEPKLDPVTNETLAELPVKGQTWSADSETPWSALVKKLAQDRKLKEGLVASNFCDGSIAYTAGGVSLGADASGLTLGAGNASAGCLSIKTPAQDGIVVIETSASSGTLTVGGTAYDLSAGSTVRHKLSAAATVSIYASAETKITSIAYKSLAAVTVSTSAQLKEALANGNPEITLAYSTTPYELDAVTLNGQDVKLIGQAVGGKNPRVVTKGFNLQGTFESGISIEHIDFTQNGDSDCNLFNVNADNTVLSALTVKDADISGFGKSVFYANKTITVSGALTFDGVMIHDMGTSQADFDFRKGTFGEFALLRSTVYNGSARNFFRTDAATSFTAIRMEANTFAGIAPGQNFLHSRAATVVTLSKNLFTAIGSTKFHSTASNAGITADNNHYFGADLTTWWTNITEEQGTANGGSVLAADPCKDAANADFTLTNADLIAAGIGAPVWRSSTAPYALTLSYDLIKNRVGSDVQILTGTDMTGGESADALAKFATSSGTPFIQTWTYQGTTFASALAAASSAMYLKKGLTIETYLCNDSSLGAISTIYLKIVDGSKVPTVNTSDDATSYAAVATPDAAETEGAYVGYYKYDTAGKPYFKITIGGGDAKITEAVILGEK